MRISRTVSSGANGAAATKPFSNAPTRKLLPPMARSMTSLSGSMPLRRRKVRVAKSENAPAPVTPTVFPLISSKLRVDLLPTNW